MGYARKVWRRYMDLVPGYWSEAATPMDFVRIMRVRLSKSKIGPIVCPRPVVVSVSLKSLGSDVFLRSHTTDISVLGEVVLGREYDAVMPALERSPELIVDLGANTGLVARALLSRFPDARLIAVEPEPGNAEMLRRNVASFGDQVVVHQCCVGGWARTAQLMDAGGEFAFTITENASSDGDPFGVGVRQATETVVDVRTMEDLLGESAGQTIDLLKCDIEGAEAELFAECAPWINDVRALIAECHEPYRADALLADIARNGGQLEAMVVERGTVFPNDIVIMRHRAGSDAVSDRTPSAP